MASFWRVGCTILYTKYTDRRLLQHSADAAYIMERPTVESNVSSTPTPYCSTENTTLSDGDSRKVTVPPGPVSDAMRCKTRTSHTSLMLIQSPPRPTASRLILSAPSVWNGNVWYPGMSPLISMKLWVQPLTLILSLGMSPFPLPKAMRISSTTWVSSKK